MNVSSLTSSSSTSTTNSAYSSNGLSGLMSGMDTETMVKEMLSGTQTKIDKQNQKKQQLEWKQTAYQESITTINDLYDKYFNASYDADITNNLASAKFFNQKTSTVTGDGIKIISTDATASLTDMSIQVNHLATKAALTSTQKMSGDYKIRGTALTSENYSDYSKTVTLKSGDQTLTVDLGGATTSQEVADRFNAAVKDLAGDNPFSGMEAKLYDGKMRLVSNAAITVDDSSSELGLAAAGLTASAASTESATGTQVVQGGDMDAGNGITFQLSLDGVTKTLTIAGVEGIDGAATDADKLALLQTAVQKQVRTAFGTSVEVGTENGGLTFAVTDNNSATANDGLGHTLTVYGASATTSLGIDAGTSSNISTSTKLGALSGVQGDSFAFTINGQDFSFDSNNTLADVISAINNSNAGVQISYSSLSDTFSMNSTSTGAQYGIEIDQTSGNLLSQMFGADNVEAGSTLSSANLTTGSVAGAAASDVSGLTMSSGSFTMKVNGENHTFTLSAKESGEAYTKDEISTKLNEWLGTEFGKNGENNIVSYDSSTNSIKTTDKSMTIAFAATSVDTEDADALATAKKSDLALALGFNTKANTNVASSGNATVGDIALLGTETGIKTASGAATETTKLSDITEIDGVAVTYKDGRFEINNSSETESKTITLNTDRLRALFGDPTNTSNQTVTLGKLGDGSVKKVQGEDASLTVNGVAITRSSNTFTLDGITMQLTGTTEEGKSATITTGQDTDTIVNALKAFVTDYNAMVDKFQGKISEEATYQKYAPLTDAQKKEMSDDEIEKWTEKAKTGLLRNDDTLSDFLSSMRNILYTKPDSSNLALYNIGISTYDKTGKLEIDETALRNALASDPQSVSNLFTDTTSGLSTKMMKTMDSVAKVSYGSAGSLVTLAGTSKLSSTLKNNTIYKQLQSISDTLDQLQDRYDNEKDRYYSMFTAMETAMSSFNTQSSLLSSYFSS